eukprot:5391976-Ditylum_brightwellii.AAC.1
MVKKVTITGDNNAHEDANADKEYKANGVVLDGFKKKKTRFANDTNYTEEDLGPNNAKEQFDQLGLNLVEEYSKYGDSPPEQ